MHTRTSSTVRRRPLVSLALAAALIAMTLPATAKSGTGLPAGFTAHDDETVYVTADATGAPRDTVVIDWLQLEGDGTITVFDPGDITGAEALKDSDEPVLVDGGVEWTLQVEGRRDFFYRADTEQELPIAVQAEYFLDGVKTDAERLAGKDGHLRIEVTVTNNLPVTEQAVFTGADGLSRSDKVEYWTPMLAPVKIDIDGTRFRNIEADAEIVSVTGSTVSHTFMTFPQPEQVVTIEMDGTDIEVDPIIVSVFPKLTGAPDLSIADDLAELKTGLDGLAELSGAHQEILKTTADRMDTSQLAQLGQMQDGFDQLVAGTQQIGKGANGLVTLLDGQIAYLNGIIGGIEGQDLSQIAALPAALAQLAEGVGSTRDGVDGLVALLGGQIAYLDGIRSSNGALESRAWAHALASADETATALAQGLSEQTMMLDGLRDGDPAMGLPYGLTDTRDRLAEVSAGLTGIADALDAIAAGSQQLSTLPAQFEQLTGALKVLRDGGSVQGQQLPGLTATRAGLAQLATGIDGVGSGIGSTAAALGPLAELPTMLEDLRSVLLALSEGGTVQGHDIPGVSMTVEGLQKMSAGLGEGIDEIELGKKTLDLMEKAADAYDTFLGVPEGATGDVRFIFRLDGIAKTEQ